MPRRILRMEICVSLHQNLHGLKGSRADGVVERRSVGIKALARSVDVDAQVDHLAQGFRLAIERGKNQSKLPFRTRCRRRQTLNIRPTFEAKRRCQRQGRSPVNEVPPLQRCCR